MKDNDLTELIIGCAIKVHKVLGPGLLESAYEECLVYELAKNGLKVKRQVPIPIVYEEVKLDCGYRLDLLVNDSVIIEIKAVEALNKIHLAQILSYLKLSNHKLGLIINFNVLKLIDGIKRVRND
ncbi:MAG: GxxExxY protein [Ignavibacteriae bacterium]|nr:GxxExxY protein [Ignavibacteriota bacterium]